MKSVSPNIVVNTIQLRQRKVELVSIVVVVAAAVFFLRWPIAKQHSSKLEFYSLDGFLCYARPMHVAQIRFFFFVNLMKWPTFAPVFVSFYVIYTSFFYKYVFGGKDI